MVTNRGSTDGLKASVARARHEGAEPRPAAVFESAPEPSIFVVHGDGPAIGAQLDLALRRLGLQPAIVVRPGGGVASLAEHLARGVGDPAAPTFGIVLLAPDDAGPSDPASSTDAADQARQDIRVAASLLLATLPRERVAILRRGVVGRRPGVNGGVHLGFSEHIREVVPKLALRMQQVGVTLTAAAIARASA